MVKKTKPIIYLLGVILYILGITSIYYYPKNAHNTYMSENALMPGTARVTFDYSDGLKITQFSNGFQNHLSRYNKQHATLHGDGKQIDKHERSQSCSQWIVEQLKEIGIESYIHKYSIDGTSGSNGNGNNTGYNVYSVLRAPKSDGRESIVLSASFNSNDESNVATPSQVNSGTESSVGVALTILQYLYKKGNIWLAKDLILIISDTFQDGSDGFGSGDTQNNIGLKSWLHDYHDSTIGSGFSNNYFPRAGLIQAAINIETSSKKYQSDHIYVLSEGSNGQLPNLDLINTVGRLAKREGYSKSMLLSPVSNGNGRSTTTGNEFGSEMIIKYLPDEMKTLARFMFNQAIGIPTGDHGLFNKYHIDAITLGVSGSSSTMGSRVLIGTIRSLNNLLERLHQSFYYYLLPSPFLYISIGEYMISLGLIISPLALGVVYFLISLSNIFTPPTIFTATTNNSTTSPSSSSTNTFVKKKNIFEKLGKFKCLDTPKDIVYSFTIIVIFQLIGVALFSLPQTFTVATENILNYLSTIEIIGLFGSFSVFYILIFIIISPIIDKMFYPTNEPIQKIIDKNSSNNNSNNTTTSTSTATIVTRNHLKSESNSFFVFSNLPILIFITTMSLLNFSFCTFASILTIPLCFISQICNGSKVTNLIRKLFVYSFLIIFSPPVLFYLFSHFVLNDQNVFLFLLQIIKQYNQYSSLLFPFLTLIYIPLNLSILKSIK